MKYKASITISRTFEAVSDGDAKLQGEMWQEYMATSNDGSEMIGNAKLNIEQIKE